MLNFNGIYTCRSFVQVDDSLPFRFYPDGTIITSSAGIHDLSWQLSKTPRRAVRKVISPNQGCDISHNVTYDNEFFVPKILETRYTFQSSTITFSWPVSDDWVGGHWYGVINGDTIRFTVDKQGRTKKRKYKFKKAKLTCHWCAYRGVDYECTNPGSKHYKEDCGMVSDWPRCTAALWESQKRL